jgi:hypothetical protein
MSDQKDGPGKPADQGGAKRPFATIDLKAVEVPADPAKASASGGPKPPEPAQPRNQSDAARKVAAAGAASASKTTATAAASVPSAGAAAATAGAEKSKPAAGKAETKPGAETTKPAGTSGASAATPAAPPAPPAVAPRGSAIGRFLSHAAAGVVGGALALYAAPHLGPALRDAGLPAPAPAVPPELVGRLAALEQKIAAPPRIDPAADPARAVAAAEANRKRLDEMTGKVDGLGATQARIAKLAADLETRITREPVIADAADRLVKMEQQLAALADAARTEPANAGRIPQLARINGRLDEMEATVTRGQADLRKDLVREVEVRTAPTAEAAEAARAAADRIAREVSGARSEQNRLATGLDQVRTATERLQLALKSSQEETAALGTAMDRLRRDLESRLQTTAKPADVSTAVAPVASKLTALEQSVAGVVKSEAERKATAERIVLALELGNLKRAMERGAPYARELAEVRKVAGAGIDLAPLDRYRNEGVPTVAGLAAAFRPVANAILDADAEKGDGTVVDRLLSGAKSFVRVRKTSHGAGHTSAEAVVARIETALKGGQLGVVLTEAKSLPQTPPAAKDWLSRVEARQTVDAALAAIDAALKSSLGAGPAPAGERKVQP